MSTEKYSIFSLKKKKTEVEFKKLKYKQYY